MPEFNLSKRIEALRLRRRGCSTSVLRVLCRCVLLLLAVGLAACGTANNATGNQAPISAQTPEVTSAATVTMTPTRTPTTMPTWTPTPVPSPTFTRTPTPEPTATATRRPTLTPWPSTGGDARKAFAPILVYHHIAEPPEKAGGAESDYYVSPASFEEQLRYLSESGYQSVSLSALHNYLEAGEPLPDRPVILTFDDGYIDNFTVALPLLVKYGFTATFFLVTDPIDGKYPGYITWAQVEEIIRSGMEVEPHSLSHSDLRKQPEEQVFREVVDAKETLEKHTGKPCRFFSYPLGAYDERVVNILRQMGFLGAVTLDHGTSVALDDMFQLPRIWVRRRDSMETFIQKLERGW